MLDIFRSVKALLKFEDVCTDNNVFRLHYKLTAVVLLGFSAMVTARQYVGSPINCMVEGVPTHIMNSYCWITSTFTVSGNKATAVHPGVSPYVHGKDHVRHTKYYQWVCFALFFQAMFFYLPRYLWKMWEGGRIRMLIEDLNLPIISDQCKTERIELLVNYFTNNLHRQNFYAIRFFICELLNFVNVLAQLFFMDYFLDGEFSSYGLEVLRFTNMDLQNRNDPMDRLFPKIAKCTFHNYGHSGTVQRFDGLCLLPVNIFNEKMYVFLWFWFLAVAFISCFQIMYRLAVIFIPSVRMYLLISKSRLAPVKDIRIIIEKCQIGDWFILNQLGLNMEALAFTKLLADLAHKWENKFYA